MRQHLAPRDQALVGLALASLTLAACNNPQTAPKLPEAPAVPAAPVAPVPPSPPVVAMPAGFSVTAPGVGAAVPSPLTVTGVAPNDWYFEAVFEAVLLDAQGNVLVEAPAQAQSDWTKPGPVPFKAVFNYAADKAQPGTVVLTEDQTGEHEDGDDKPVREVRLPVMLVAGR